MIERLKVQFDDKLITPILIGIIHFVDIVMKPVSKAIAERISCRLGSHDWQSVESEMNLRVCSKCGDIDDVTTTGIDGSTKRRRSRIISERLKKRGNK